MKLLRLSRVLAAVLPAVVASAAGALSLGRPQGLALVGRPLEVTVPVQFDAAGDPVPECASAEVFYGDVRLDPARVSAELVPGRAGATIRVRANPAVNEPVVTLYLQLGCNSNNRLTRRVVLFAELPETQAEAAPPLVGAAPRAVPDRAPVAPRAIGQAPAAGTAAAGRRGGGETRPPAPAAAAQSRVGPAGTALSPQAPSRAGAPGAAVARAQPRPEQRGPRLQLSPVDVPAGTDPRLRLTDTLASPEGVATQRAAAAALWRALNADPEAQLRDAQRLQALERDVAGLRDTLRQREARVGELQAQLESARAERYGNPLVYVLAALLALACAVAAWAWRRRARPQHEWWATGQDSTPSGLGPSSLGPDSRAPVVVGRASQGPASSSVSGIDFDLAEFEAPQKTMPYRAGAFASEPAAARLPPAAILARGDADEDHGPASVRSLKAEELHDVQQEADFFMTLGEHERAIETLRAHIGQNPETSAVAWLDLLDIFQKLGRREEFDRTSEDFERKFNARVPPYEQYREEAGGGGLEDYPGAMSRIVALWPSRRVLDVIEESIFRSPGDDGQPAFSLEAYRELLLLHRLGEEVMGRDAPVSAMDSSGFPMADSLAPSGFSHTSIDPLSAHGHAPRSSIGVDIDLGFDDAEVVAPPALADSGAVDFDLPDIEFDRLKKRRE